MIQSIIMDKEWQRYYAKCRRCGFEREFESHNHYFSYADFVERALKLYLTSVRHCVECDSDTVFDLTGLKRTK